MLFELAVNVSTGRLQGLVVFKCVYNEKPFVVILGKRQKISEKQKDILLRLGLEDVWPMLVYPRAQQPHNKYLQQSFGLHLQNPFWAVGCDVFTSKTHLQTAYVSFPRLLLYRIFATGVNFEGGKFFEVAKLVSKSEVVLSFLEDGDFSLTF